MAMKLYNESSIQNIANAIREKNGSSSTYTVGEMSQAISNLTGDSQATDISLNITGATVGQTVKISAVDDNGVPTAWEPVDMASGGAGAENAFTISETTTEAVEVINLAIPVAWDRILTCNINISIPARDVEIQLYAYAPSSNTGVGYAVVGTIPASKAGANLYMIKKKDGTLMVGKNVAGNYPENATPVMGTGAGFVYGAGAIGLNIYDKNGTELPSGTSIYCWGVYK